MASRNLRAVTGGAVPGGAARGAATAASLHIDWTLCDGRGLCTELLPESLARDEWGYPVGRTPVTAERSDVPVPRASVAAARDAVALCPRQALSLR
ncbi:MAG: hypothetical protein JWR01_297 [Subtercola sp.]|nr:hypothetical protein [Subtercola sp.]